MMETTTEKTFEINQDPVSFQFGFDEHHILCDALTALLNYYDVIPYHELADLDPESETRKNYELLDKMRNRVYHMWSQRFETDE